MSEWIDVSQRIRPGIPVWPSDVFYAYRTTWTRGAGDSVNVGELALSTHTGTHIDAPYHFEDRGTIRNRASSPRLCLRNRAG